jgi:hypothetical protein
MPRTALGALAAGAKQDGDQLRTALVVTVP